MAAPSALTRTPPPSLDFSRPGTPAAEDFGDIYFSTDGGLEESRAVFLNGCGLPDAWQDRDSFIIAELGFGSGLNFLATWQAWRQSGAKGRLHFISVEAFPFDREQLTRALSHFPELADLSEQLIAAWPGPVRGVHRRHFDAVSLTLIHDAVGPALDSQTFKADAWFLDGFSPAKNPDMWTTEIMQSVARLSAPGASIASFTVAGSVRQALTEAGYVVEKRPGFGRKRHRLEARLTGVAEPMFDRPAPTIIGAGIAGASIAAAFKRRAISPNILFDPDHPAASGNGAALVKPRLDLQDKPESRFFLSSFLYARRLYEDVGAVRHSGVRHRPKTPQEAERLQRIANQEPLGPGHLHWQDDALNMLSSLVIDTEAARTSFLHDLPVIPQKIAPGSLPDGPIILACGYGIRALRPDLPFRFSRGQLSWTVGDVAGPVTYGGYAIPIRDKILLGATHERISDHAQAFSIRPQDDETNLTQAQAQGLSVGPEVETFRTSVRVNTAQTLPCLTRLKTDETEQEIWLLSGLGSRGFVYAPLLGEALVSAYLGEPSPLSVAMSDILSRSPQ